MSIPEALYSLLATGAELVASKAAGEFAKGAGKTAFDALKAAFDALKARLVSNHCVASLALVDQAEGNAAYETAIKSDLNRSDIWKDTEVRRLVNALRAAIEALPEAVKASYAVDIRVIESGRDLLFDDVEGVRSEQAISQRNMTFRNVKAPPGK
ncbi:hypothetical protein [Bradyrhizobium sp.]|uniref:hypothetical protein n=1 Tax=Bradyrhizobium sp. TaxID=376 RepID=UPI003C4733A8